MAASSLGHRRFSHNVVANAVGRFWSLVASLVFVPIYLAHLGGEAYGLIVFYVTLFATIAALDAGLGSVLTRQVSIGHANSPAGAASDSHVLDIARTVEIILAGMAIFIAAVILALAPWIVNHWLNITTLPRAEAITAVRLMGIIVAVQWPAIAYQGALVGLERQVRLNVIRTGFAAAQSICAAALVAFAGGGVRTFFLVVLVSQCCCTLTLRRAMWQGLRKGTERPGRFAIQEVVTQWRFALGMAVIAMLSALLTQTDKLVMSREAPLIDFSDYGISATICGLLAMVGYPVFSAALPKLTRSVSSGERRALETTYLLSCEVIAALAVPAWAMLTFFPTALMSLWIGHGAIASKVARIIPIYAAGSLMNVLVLMPFALQIASGWTSLSIKKNVLTAAISVPLLIFAISRWGGQGAAAVWVAINLGYLVFEVPIVHSRMFGAIKPYWWIRIVLLPVAIASISATIFKATVAMTYSLLAQGALLIGFGLLLTILVALSMSTIRAGVRASLFGTALNGE
jgi:O-antigen/teichoic acid export membrane protein